MTLREGHQEHRLTFLESFERVRRPDLQRFRRLKTQMRHMRTVVHGESPKIEGRVIGRNGIEITHRGAIAPFETQILPEAHGDCTILYNAL